MKKYLHYILPLLIVGCVTLEHFGILHIGYLYIKSHELKWTDLDYNYHPREGDIFTTGESVSNNNYEDGLIAFLPNYRDLLDQDLKKISDNRKQIDLINSQELTFFSDEYMIKACIDQKDISINDSTLFKKLVNVEIVGGYELYDKDGCELLYHKENEKFWIRDQIIMRGYARQPFVDNKIDEIVLAQMSNNAHLIIPQFETPYIYRAQLRALNNLQSLYSLSDTPMDSSQLYKRSASFLNNLYRKMYRGSDVYGHRNDPDYLSKISQAEVLESLDVAIKKEEPKL